MKDFEKALDHITGQIELYRETDVMDGESLVEVLKQITATLFYLEKERSSYHNKFQTLINQLVTGGDSVARAENEAHKQIPEMYLLRHIMTSAYEVVGAIRTNISWLKTEKHYSDTQK